MAEASFYWHDYETWGANPRVDRPAQFAGIRTDMNLDIIGEPLMIYARPTADFLPHPEAVLITGITPQKAAREGLVEAEFFAAIHREFSEPGSCIVGYNNIRFDDEVTRFGFYRNFFDPYAYGWKNGNSRWDVLDLMRLTHALRPQGIEWPQHDDGAVSFRLTDLTAANRIEQSGAHDALVDVRATIELARLVRRHQPRLFDYYHGLRDKKRAAALLNPGKPEVVLHVSGMFPAVEGCLAPVFPLLAHPHNANEIICFNLRHDPGFLQGLDVDQIREKLYTRSLDLAHGEQRLPLKGVHLNRSPALAPVSTLDPGQAEKWNIDWGSIERHRDMLAGDPGLVSRLLEVYGAERGFEKTDADNALYEGFIGEQDRRLCNRLLESSPDQMVLWDGEPFGDPRLNTLLFRYRARNFPSSLSGDETVRWRRFCHARVVDGDHGAGLTLEQFQQQLITLAQHEQGEREQQLLDQLSRWVQQLFD